MKKIYKFALSNIQKQMEFIRYGSLKPQKHKIKDGFHSAPAELGFYAFPRGYVEQFLLGGVGSGSIENGRYRFLRDESGNKISAFLDDVFDYYNKTFKEPFKTLARKKNIKFGHLYPYIIDECGNIEFVEYFYEERLDTLRKQGKKFNYIYETKPVRFKYNVNIWHHFETYGDKVIEKPAYIIKKSKYGNWILTDMKTFEKALKSYENRMRYDFRLGNGCRLPLDRFAKDEFEVFIEHI